MADDLVALNQPHRLTVTADLAALASGPLIAKSAKNEGMEGGTMPRPERMVRRRGVMVVEDGAPVCVHLIPPPFAEAFDGVLQDLLALRLRAAAEGRIEWPALNAACRDLARIWYLQQPAGPVVDQGDVRDAEVLFRDRADGSVPR